MELFDDNFRAGLDGAWDVPPLQPVTVRTAAEGLTVTPADTDPLTGEPAFAPPAEGRGGGPGPGDHLAWVALARGPGGARGFEVPADGTVECAATLSARGLGGARHPFGAAVPDPDGDVRLATAALITMDPLSHVVCDFLLTNTRVHALYERVPFPGERYAAFSYAVPVASRTPGAWHRLSVRYEAGGTRVVWRVEGVEVFRVDRPGLRPADRGGLLLDHGGEEGEPVRLGRMVPALGLLTLLDGAGPDGRGLVRPAAGSGTWFDPRVGAPREQEFVGDDDLLKQSAWRPGAVLGARRVTVRAEVDSGVRGS